MLSFYVMGCYDFSCPRSSQEIAPEWTQIRAVFLGDKTACLTLEFFHNVALIYAANNM
jgi:hypothetical protein